MKNLSLSPDESIILTSQNIVVEGIRHEAVLTSRRLILIRGDDPKSPVRELPLSGIGSAIAGENALREPTITLALTTPDGVLQTLQLVFIRLSSETKNNQYDEWVSRLKERITVMVEEPARTFSATFQEALAGEPGATDLPGSDRSQVHGVLPQIPGYVFRPPKPVVVSQEDNISKIAVVVIVIAVIAIGVIVLTTFLQPVKPAASPGTPAPTLSSSASANPEVTLTPTPVPTPAVTSEGTPVALSKPQFTIPSSGVWLRIQYPGTFIGSLGSRGSMREVNSSGDRFYQIPATEGIIEAQITKADGSGDLLMLELYKDGNLVRRMNSTTPHGILYLNTVL
jgi:hypothetical protein